jgi:chromosome segregation protein
MSREEELSRDIAELRKACAESDLVLESLDAELQKARAYQASLKAERDFLAEVLNTFAGYSDGVRYAAGMEELRGRILCVLGDIISSEERHLRAVEAALAESLQSIVVDNLDAALDGARRLACEQHGRAVFLPAGDRSFKDRVSLEKGGGILGPAHEFVCTEERFRPIVRRLLRDTYLVDSLETACRLHARFGEGRFVTLDGSLVGVHGEIHSGANDDSGAGATIGRGEKLERLEEALESACACISGLEKRRSACAADADRLRASIRDREHSLEDVRRETAALASEEARASAKREGALETLAALRIEMEHIEETFGSSSHEIGALEEKIARFTEHHNRMEKCLRSTAEEIADIRSELDVRRTRLNACEVEHATLTEKRAARTREVEAAAEQREALAQTARTLLREVSETEGEMLDAGKRKQALLREIESLGAELERLSGLKAELDRRASDLQSRRSEMERALQNLRREQAESTRRESALTLERDEAAMRIQAVVEHLSDEFFIAPENVPEPSADTGFDPETERLLIEDLKRKIQTLGDVNMAAETDYREEKERLDFLVRERDDLVEARKTLDETIRKINHIARERFKETFERIRVNFNKTFADFFEGGICDLALEEGEDPLEANILITARPPGKNVRSINLLSSGERALTAISLLFAIYLVKPSPFCILDEVDAPLDDASIDRFLRVIREFARSTQFIIVTHNKKTMAAADNLYGITMEEPGLSTLVSVKLSQAGEKQITMEPEHTGESAVAVLG